MHSGYACTPLLCSCIYIWICVCLCIPTLGPVIFGLQARVDCHCPGYQQLQPSPSDRLLRRGHAPNRQALAAATRPGGNGHGYEEGEGARLDSSGGGVVVGDVVLHYHLNNRPVAEVVL